MTKKDSERDSLRYLETPTAAFPIGSLGLDKEDGDDEDEERTALRNLVEDLDLEETRPMRRRSRLREEEKDTEVMLRRSRIDDLLAKDPEPRVQPFLLALSLLGGGILAVGVVAVFGMWLLYVN
ncbi:MAG: hypothetical protein AAF602_12180 [Myxococcota bacterium]